MAPVALLVLDLNRVLIHGDDHPDEGLVDLVRRCWAEGRPEVAVWTSSTGPVARRKLQRIFTRAEIKRFLFVWTRNMVKMDPAWAGTSHQTIKLLDDLLLHPYINAGMRYDPGNILLVDDSPEKLRFNDPRSSWVWDGDVQALARRLDLGRNS